MLDLRADLTTLWRTMARLTAHRGGRAVMFMSARGGEGTSSVAASAGLMVAARASRTAWLVDLDLRQNPAHAAFEAGFARGIGKPGRALDASLQTDQIYAVSGGDRDPANAKLLTAHQIDGTRLLVTRFRNERLPAGQKVQMRTSTGWWLALREMSDWIVVDAPPLARAPAGLAMASQMDGVFLVARADETSTEELGALRLEIEAHGGKVLGVVMNRLRADARFAERLARTA